MHARLEKVQFSALSVTLKPHHCQPGQMLFPSLRGYGLGEGWLTLGQFAGVKGLESSSTWVGRAVLHGQSQRHSSLGVSVHIPDPYL